MTDPRRWSVADAAARKGAAGMMECRGAAVFLKEVKGQTFRFTVKSAARELKLRADRSRRVGSRRVGSRRVCGPLPACVPPRMGGLVASACD